MGFLEDKVHGIWGPGSTDKFQHKQCVLVSVSREPEPAGRYCV